MNSIDLHKIKTAGGIAALCIALLATGYGAGLLIGNRFMESIVLKEGRLPLLLSRPVNQFYDMYSLINSSNPFSRLSGYYSLVDNNMVNEQFIADRYGREQFIVIQRTLLWVLSHSKDTGKALKFYASIYTTSDGSLKKDILRYMTRLDKKYYDGFIKANKVDPLFLPE
jgi:hypothetical protein